MIRAAHDIRQFATAALLAAAVSLTASDSAAEACFTDLEHADVTIDGVHMIDWDADPAAQGYCQVVEHYAVVCDAPSAAANCTSGLRGAWGTKVVRVQEFIFNEDGKFARIAVPARPGCAGTDGETGFLRLSGTTCVFRPETSQ